MSAHPDPSTMAREFFGDSMAAPVPATRGAFAEGVRVERERLIAWLRAQDHSLVRLAAYLANGGRPEHVEPTPPASSRLPTPAEMAATLAHWPLSDTDAMEEAIRARDAAILARLGAIADGLRTWGILRGQADLDALRAELRGAS